MTYKGKSLQTATEAALASFSRDYSLVKYFRGKEEEIGEDDSVNNERDSEIDQYYNNKRIIDRMGAEKDSVPVKESSGEKEGIGSLPFLATSRPNTGMLSPHADTLDIGDLEDVESVKSDRSD
jgi:hypothetical protein